MDDRHGSASTVMVSQLPVDQWYVTVGDNTLADALLDRLIHNAHRLALKGESMMTSVEESIFVYCWLLLVMSSSAGLRMNVSTA